MIIVGHLHIRLHTGLAGIHGQRHKEAAGRFCMLPDFILRGTINLDRAVRFFNVVFKAIIYFLCGAEKPKKRKGKAKEIFQNKTEVYQVKSEIKKGFPGEGYFFDLNYPRTPNDLIKLPKPAVVPP
jgi:hypothetical protein